MQQDFKTRIRSYKQEINLVSFLQKEGFEIDREKTSRKWPALKHPATNEQLIVGRSQSSGEWFYFNRDDDRDRGTVVDYVSRRQSLDLSQKKDWEQLHQYLATFQNAPCPPPIAVESQAGEQVTRSRALSQYFKMSPLTDTAYLTQRRHLSPETLKHPAFEGKIFNKPFTHKETGEYVMNTVFPMENRRGLQAILLKNDSPTGFINGNTWGAKGEALWVSRLPTGHRPKEILIFENPIDALSYHQLNPPQEPFERFYIATGGQPSAIQPILIQEAINKIRPERVILANDNDPAGIRFNINYSGFLMRPDLPNKTDIRSAHLTFQRHTASLLITVNGSEDQAASLGNKLQLTLDKDLLPDMVKSSVDVVTKYDSERLIRIDFPNTRPFLIRTEQFLLTHRSLQDFLIPKRPIEKDWNESLKASLGQQVNSAPKIENINL